MRAAAILALGTVAGALASAPALAGPFKDDTGRQLYTRFCASCHGEAGFGDGPVAPSLEVLVPDLTRLHQRSGGRFPEERVRKIIDGRETWPAHGTRLMPVWGYELRAATGTDAAGEAEAGRLVDRMVQYLRSIQQ